MNLWWSRLHLTLLWIYYIWTNWTAHTFTLFHTPIHWLLIGTLGICRFVGDHKYSTLEITTYIYTLSTIYPGGRKFSLELEFHYWQISKFESCLSLILQHHSLIAYIIEYQNQNLWLTLWSWPFSSKLNWILCIFLSWRVKCNLHHQLSTLWLSCPEIRSI